MYAGFWKRLAAFIIDNIIAYVLLLVVMAFTGYNEKISNPATMGITLLLFSLYSLLVYVLYWSLFESSSLQATPGKMALGIKVTDMNGNRIPFGRALGRNLGKIVSGLTLNIGYAMAGFTIRKQALHDKMASCLVIDKNADIQNLQPLPPASGTLIFFAILGALSPFILYIAAMIFIFVAFFKMTGIPMFPPSSVQTSERSAYVSAEEDSQNDIELEGDLFSDKADFSEQEIRKVKMMGNLLKVIAKIQEMYAEKNNGQYAKTFEELKANMPGFPEQDYEVGNYKLALGKDYITASAEEADGVPAHTITHCYAKDKICIYANVFKFVKEVDIPYSQPDICCL